MVDTAKIEAEAKELAAETTSVISSLLGTWNPRWPRFVETWKGWSLRKKGIALVLAAAACGFVSAFGVSTLRLISGSYRSAYAYGHGQNVTPSEVKDQITAALASAPTRAQFNDLEAKVHQIEVEMQAVEDRLSASPAQITTGSIPKKSPVKKPARKSASSSWFNLP